MPTYAPIKSTRTIVIVKRDGSRKTFETPYTNQQARERLRFLVGVDVTPIDKDAPLGYSLFACNLAVKRTLSTAQWNWVHALVIDEERKQARLNDPANQNAANSAQPKAEKSLKGIRGLLDSAAKGKKLPKITFKAPTGTVKLARTGSSSTQPGTIHVTDGKPYGQSAWYGKIDLEGTWIPSRNCPESVEALLSKLDEDPAGYAAAYGKRTGSCCFCSKELSTKESLHVGYGKICAGNHGLPWGHTE